MRDGERWAWVYLCAYVRAYTLPSDSMPLHTHSQIRNHPRNKQRVSEGTRPPVSNKFGWPVVFTPNPPPPESSSNTDQSVILSQLHDGRVAAALQGRHLPKSTAPVPIVAFVASVASAHGSGLPNELPRNHKAHATITL